MRAQPRRGMMLCMIVAAAVLVAAAAPSREARIDAATRAATSMFEPWLGSIPPASQAPVVTSAWPASPLTMDVESQVALQIARRYWDHQPPTILMDGAARYLSHRVIVRMFDVAAGRAGSGVDTLRLFGGAYTRSILTLRFDGPGAGLGRDHLASAPARAALAFGSLERLAGEPRLIGALRSVIEAKPASDSEVIRVLQEALGEQVAWLFAPALDPSKSMNYRIAGVATEDCAPAPCRRVRVEVVHDGPAAFRDLEVRVDFADGQSPSIMWNGVDRSRVFVFEGPADPVRVRVDPELVNLLDDDLLDQSREIGATTNAPVTKWMARWTVWLQDAMLAFTALV